MPSCIRKRTESGRELVETRNQADAIVHASEKSLKDLGDKVDAATKASVEKEIENVKKVMTGDDIDAIKAAVDALTTASHKLAELMYAQAAKENPEAAAAAQAEQVAAGAGGSGKKNDDDVVDADFEEVK